MGIVLQFPYPSPRTVKLTEVAAAEARPGLRGRSAEIILFPGIAIERWHDAVRKRRKPRARKKAVEVQA